MTSLETAPHPSSRPTIGRINWLGTFTLYKREVWRFAKVWNQTIVAPVITTLLFLAIFTLALGREHEMVEGMRFDVFIAPGLIMMAIVQNAFANSSSSLMLSKVQGVIIDLLMPPFTPGEITFAMMLGGMTRGAAVGIAVYSAMLFFVPIEIHSIGLAIAFVLLSSMMLALLGLIGGLWAQTFDQMSALTNYLIAPLAFLSGTFYSVKKLPDIWYVISHYNPFFYMIDGIRYALTGYSDGNVITGLIVLASVNGCLWVMAIQIIRSGYRLKS